MIALGPSVFRLSAKLLFLSFLLCGSTPVTAQQEDKIRPEVWEALGNNDRTDVLIIFSKQLPSSSFRMIKNRTERASRIQEALVSQRKQQAPLISYLHQEQVDYQPFYILNMVRAKLDETELLKVSSFEEVQLITRNDPVVQDVQPLDENIALRSTEWGIQDIQAERVWQDFGITGEGAVIGGQDTGYDWAHPAVSRQYRGTQTDTIEHDFHWHDAIHEFFAGGNPCGLDLDAPCDDHGHGTHTVGTMVGDDGAGNQIGVAPNAKWVGCRNMEEGIGTLSTYAECFEWFLAPYATDETFAEGKVEMAPHVINNSWSCPPSEGCNASNFFILDSIVSLLRNAGIAVVVSAGNSGPNCQTVSTPAAMFDGSITVGATNSNEEIAGFSSRGVVRADGSNRMKPDVSAPGVNVRSSLPNERYGRSSGTSMAGPHVAGTIGLMISANPFLEGEVDSLEAILKRTARPKISAQDCGAPGQVPNNVFGYGIIDAYAAVEEAITAINMELIDFWGTPAKQSNLLYWNTAREAWTDVFEVQKSYDRQNWSVISQINAQGHSEVTTSYSELDPNASAVTYYRLVLIDELGDEDIGPVIRIDRDDHPQITAFPNPADQQVQIVGPDAKMLNGFSCEIIDMVGRTWMQGKLSDQRLGVRNLPEGLYMLQIKDANQRVIQTQKVLIQH